MRGRERLRLFDGFRDFAICNLNRLFTLERIGQTECLRRSQCPHAVDANLTEGSLDLSSKQGIQERIAYYVDFVDVPYERAFLLAKLGLPCLTDLLHQVLIT